MAGDFMQVDVSSLRMQPGQSKKYDLTADLKDIFFAGEPLNFDSPVQVSVTLTNTGKSIQAEGEVKADLHLKCARCLSPFVYHLETKVQGEFRHEKNTAGDDLNPAEDEELYFYSGNNLDLTDIVVESILLDLPMKAVCSEDCKGLCPICGTNLNEGQCECRENDIDPRLAVLQKLITASTGKED